MELHRVTEPFLEAAGVFKPYKPVLTEGTSEAFWGALQLTFSTPMANSVNNCAKMALIPRSSLFL